jgi:hypothetical protein
MGSDASGQGDSMKQFWIFDFGFWIQGFKGKREFCLALCAMLLALSLPVEAQQAKAVPKIGYLSASTRVSHMPSFQAFQEGLRELGYVEGRNITIEARFAEGKANRLPELVSELIRLKVDILLAGGSEAVRPVKEASETIPIVVAHFEDPVAEGFVASLAHPGRKHHRAKQDVERLGRQAPRVAQGSGSYDSPCGCPFESR